MFTFATIIGDQPVTVAAFVAPNVTLAVGFFAAWIWSEKIGREFLIFEGDNYVARVEAHDFNAIDLTDPDEIMAPTLPKSPAYASN